MKNLATKIRNRELRNLKMLLIPVQNVSSKIFHLVFRKRFFVLNIRFKNNFFSVEKNYVSVHSMLFLLDWLLNQSQNSGFR